MLKVKVSDFDFVRISLHQFPLFAPMRLILIFILWSHREQDAPIE
ncbi:hypothetical protein I593_03664 [Acinetobacter tandoii DSM 14970 = CIP 107469]|uniref:Uncharacterized protein n=1 Tax=Acinetobacter tandoii DSM 14970 = CIP 107469 TaxID=1120927 RepID=R9AQP1_9GAMM|nr:hypothetical protein I593_03664 [Acinetobacter tandoii DSM 14970 = CIP 107469]